MEVHLCLISPPVNGSWSPKHASPLLNSQSTHSCVEPTGLLFQPPPFHPLCSLFFPTVTSRAFPRQPLFPQDRTSPWRDPAPSGSSEGSEHLPIHNFCYHYTIWSQMLLLFNVWSLSCPPCFKRELPPLS